MEGLAIAALIVFAILGAPLFVIFGAAAMFFFSHLPDTPITGAAEGVFGDKFANSPLLVTIPLFTFAGYLMAESGTPKRLVELSRAWLGWLPGGLAIVCVMASAFFTTFTGGSGITIVAIGGLLFPALMADKYPEKFSLGVVTTGGSLGLLFPPSLPIILYGVVAGVLIEKLFLAGILPGLLTLFLLAGYSIFVGKKIKREREPFDLKSATAALWRTKWEVMLPIFLVGGMATVLRIHEAAAFTAIYVLIIEVFVYRDISFRKDLPRIIRESMTLVGAILVILAAALGFTEFLGQAEVPQKIVELMATVFDPGTTGGRIGFLLVLNVFLLVVGMLMDIFSAVVVVVPLIVPLARAFHIDPYHLGIVFLLNLEIGYLTPPVGLNLFISSFRFNKPVTVLYRAVLPFIGLLLIALMITTYVPELSTTMTGLLKTEEVIDLGEPAPGDDSAADQDWDPEAEGDYDDELGDGPGLDDLDDLEGDGETLDDLEGGGETLDDLEGDHGGETLDDLEGGGGGGETLDDLERQP